MSSKQYIVICKHGAPFFTEWLLFPNWAQVVCIIDRATEKYLLPENWPQEESPKNWQEMPEDHL